MKPGYSKNGRFAVLSGKLIFVVTQLLMLSPGFYAQTIAIDSTSAEAHAIDIKYAGIGMKIGSTESYGIKINRTGYHGIDVSDAQGYGIRVNRSNRDGIIVDRSFGNGITVSHSEDHGINILDSDLHGINVSTTLGDGIRIHNSAAHGINVRWVVHDAIYVHDALGWSMNIQGRKSANPAMPSDHIAMIRNRATGGGPDVLALKVEPGNPNFTCNFITFFDGFNKALGAIEGNGSGGISYSSGGADFAEYLPVESEKDSFQAGDIVGIHDGKISYETKKAAQVMVITDRPIMVGNRPDNADGFQKVSFIGQVPVKVTGKVMAGDWICASGNNDGIGIALNSKEISVEYRIVGRSWETNLETGIKKVNVVVGLDQSESLKVIIENQQREIDEINALIKELVLLKK